MLRLYKRWPLATQGQKRNERIALPHPICYGGATSWPRAQSHLVPSSVQSLFWYGLVLSTVAQLRQRGAGALAPPPAQAAGVAGLQPDMGNRD